jgi:hypothetical protein
MSRIGKKPVPIPSGVTASVDGQLVAVKGPKGELKHVLVDEVIAKLDDGALEVAPLDDTQTARAMWGMSRTYERTQTRGIPVVELRPLHRPTMLRIDRHDKSFWGAANSKGHDTALGLMERQRVKVWTRHAYAEFQRLGL